jgi:hypothetical protein
MRAFGILFARAAGLNFPLEPLIADGCVTAVQIDPAELSPGELRRDCSEMSSTTA